MSINTQCPFCDMSYRLKDEAAGKKAICQNPSCRKAFTVPMQSGPAAAQPAVAAVNGLAGKPAAIAPPPTAKPIDVAKTAAAKPPVAKTATVAAANRATSPSAPPQIKLDGNSVEATKATPPSVKPAAPTLKAAAPVSRAPSKEQPRPPSAPPAGSSPGNKSTLSLHEIEDLGHQALKAAAQAEETPVEMRKIHMICAICDHKWDVEWEKQGKNILCPECRHLQKVPLQKVDKPRDWRKEDDGPSLAKKEVLEGVVATSQMRNISADTHIAVGLVESNIEPRPRWHFVVMVLVPLVMLVALGWTVKSFFNSRTETKIDTYMADAVKEMQEVKDPPIPVAEIPLFRAVIDIVAGEHAVETVKTEDQRSILESGINSFAAARLELDSASGNTDLLAERDLLVVDLLLAQMTLGDDARADFGTRIRWVPQPAARARINTKDYNVQEELVNTFKILRKEDRPAPLETRLAALRLVCREANRLGGPEMGERLIPAGFTEQEQLEASAWTIAEAVRSKSLNRADAGVKLNTLGVPQAPPPIVMALSQFVPEPVKGLKLEPLPTAGAQLLDDVRLAHVILLALRENWAEATEVAKRPGTPEIRLKCLALLAEWSNDPTMQTKAAAEILGGKESKNIPLESVSARVARIAANAGDLESAESLMKSIDSPGIRAFVKSDILRNRLKKEFAGKPAEDTLAEIPAKDADRRVGHARSRMFLARHNVKVSGVPAGGSKFYDAWERGFRQFGIAGLALGYQDRTR